MKCVEFERRLHKLLDARRDPEADEPLREHALECEDCDLTLQAQRLLFAGLARRPACEPSPELTRRVVASYLSERKRVSSATRNWPRRALAAAALAALLLMALVPKSVFQSSDSVARRDSADPPAAIPMSALNDLARDPGGFPDLLEIPVEPGGIVEPGELYRRWLADMAEQVQRLSADTPRPVEELTTSWRPVANSIYTAIGVLRQTLPGGRPQDTDLSPGKPQAQLFRTSPTTV